jgi:hypothetical protein
MTTRSGDRGGIGYLLVGQPAISSVVARALATKGDQPQYLEGRYELGVQALDLTEFEYRWLRRTQTWQAWASQAAVAAQIQGVQLFLSTAPFGRTVLAVIEEITIINANAAAQTIAYGLSTTTQGITSGPFFGYPADDRSVDAVGAAQSLVGLGTLSAAASPLTVNRAGLVSILPGDSKTLRGPWILSGKVVSTVSETFCIASTNINQIVQASFRWYERDMLASEL